MPFESFIQVEFRTMQRKLVHHIPNLATEPASQTSLMVSPHPLSFNHICSKRNGLFRRAIIPSGLIMIGLWSDEWALMCCTLVAGLFSSQESLLTKPLQSRVYLIYILNKRLKLCLVKIFIFCLQKLIFKNKNEKQFSYIVEIKHMFGQLKTKIVFQKKSLKTIITIIYCDLDCA